MATANDTADDVELYHLASTEDLADVELSQDHTSLKAIDSRDEFRLSDHTNGYTVYFGGVERRNGKWVFYVNRGDSFTTVHTRNDYPPAIEAVLRRIADLTEDAQ